MALYHHSTLPKDVKDKIYNIIRNSTFTYSHHAWERKELKGIATWEYIAENGKIIEFNHDPKYRKHKALLRTDDGHCAVFGLTTKSVVTMWYNSPSDNHKTIDASKYKGGVKYL